MVPFIYRLLPTEYQCIYRQMDKDLYDVRYNYKELNEDTGKESISCPVREPLLIG